MRVEYNPAAPVLWWNDDDGAHQEYREDVAQLDALEDEVTAKGGRVANRIPKRRKEEA